ncbi:hypothetical protein GCM10023185_38570 [Hymenobacter saemangeumensis]|uniref:6-bladed beta-propeller n=1 Tax=Hymenobacter saemangeumensis TaxID=1084522 RepID=A0ABP8IQI9_9BACT
MAALLCGGEALAQPTVPSAASVAPASVISPVGKAPTAPAAGPAAPAGSWRLLRQIPLKNPGAASLDRRGALYVADASNNLQQFGAEGLPLNRYAPPLPGNVAQVEAWNVTNILLFYDDRQELVMLDRFLTPLAQLRLSEYFEGTVRVATLAPDNHIWLLDESNLVLREFDSNTLRLTQSTPLDLLIGCSRPDFRFLRQYQNNTYLVDRNSGIYVFDNLGNYRKKLPFAGLSTLGFRGDELYFVQDGSLRFFHLYNLTERSLALPAGVDAGTVRQVLLGEGFAYVLTSAGISVYQI